MGMTWRHIKHKDEVKVGSIIGLGDKQSSKGRYMTRVHRIEDNRAWGFWYYETEPTQKNRSEQFLWLDAYITNYYILNEKKSSYEDPDYANLWV